MMQANPFGRTSELSLVLAPGKMRHLSFTAPFKVLHPFHQDGFLQIMVVTSFLIVFLQRGAGEIATNFRLNESVADILTGVIIFFIIGCEFFINYEIRPRAKHKEGK